MALPRHNISLFEPFFRRLAMRHRALANSLGLSRESPGVALARFTPSRP